MTISALYHLCYSWYLVVIKSMFWSGTYVLVNFRFFTNQKQTWHGALFLCIDCLINLSHGLEFDPRLGYKIDDPEDFHHNGTYLCEFTDSGKGKKFSSLVIDLLVTAKKVTKTFVKVRQILLYYGTL